MAAILAMSCLDLPNMGKALIELIELIDAPRLISNSDPISSTVAVQGFPRLLEACLSRA